MFYYDDVWVQILIFSNSKYFTHRSVSLGHSKIDQNMNLITWKVDRLNKYIWDNRNKKVLVQILLGWCIHQKYCTS